MLVFDFFLQIKYTQQLNSCLQLNALLLNIFTLYINLCKIRILRDFVLLLFIIYYLLIKYDKNAFIRLRNDYTFCFVSINRLVLREIVCSLVKTPYVNIHLKNTLQICWFKKFIFFSSLLDNTPVTWVIF